MISNTLIFLIFLIIIGGLFVGYKAARYIFKRRLVPNYDNFRLVEGQNVDMLGFKFSVLLVITMINLIITIILLYNSEKQKIIRQQL